MKDTNIRVHEIHFYFICISLSSDTLLHYSLFVLYIVKKERII